MFNATFAFIFIAVVGATVASQVPESQLPESQVVGAAIWQVLRFGVFLRRFQS